jgi:transcriptional regulator with XRE-family HTH domain
MGLSKAFGQILRKARVARKLSQERLAEQSGLHRNFIGMLERAEASASMDSLEAIAAALQCRASDLVKAAEQELLKGAP